MRAHMHFVLEEQAPVVQVGVELVVDWGWQVHPFGLVFVRAAARNSDSTVVVAGAVAVFAAVRPYPHFALLVSVAE